MNIQWPVLTQRLCDAVAFGEVSVFRLIQVFGARSLIDASLFFDPPPDLDAIVLALSPKQLYMYKKSAMIAFVEP